MFRTTLIIIVSLFLISCDFGSLQKKKQEEIKKEETVVEAIESEQEKVEAEVQQVPEFEIEKVPEFSAPVTRQTDDWKD